MAQDLYSSLVRRYAAEYGVPLWLAEKTVETESSWNPNAVSPVGAGGIMQFMPGTAADYGLKPEDRFDPELAIPAGMKHLRDLYDKTGRWDLALAGYNAGVGAVQKHGGVPPYKETQNYVSKIMSAAPPGFDPRTAGLNDVGAPAVSPYSLPDKTAVQTSQGGGMEPNAFENPWVQMGLGVLSNMGQPGFGGVFQGIQQGGLLASKLKYERELVNARVNKVSEPTALERQLQSAGLVPGTPAYSAAIMQYLYKPSTQVNIGGENPVPLPQGALAPVNPKDLSKGYIYPDERSPTGTTVKVPTGTITPTEGEAGKISSLVGARQALDKIESLSAAGANITDLGGVVSELMAKPNLTGAAAREVAKRFGYEVDENTAGALVEMARQTALISAYISGADVPTDQKESFQEFLPRPGDPPAVLEYKLKSTRDFLNQLEGTQNEMRGRTETPGATTVPTSAAPGGYTEAERATAAKLGITLP